MDERTFFQTKTKGGASLGLLMVDFSKNMDMNNHISLGKDVVRVLEDPNNRDFNVFSECVRRIFPISSTCKSDLSETHSSFQDYLLFFPFLFLVTL
ncbi:hypothetical protein RYX36_024012 [Vicia faba]